MQNDEHNDPVWKLLDKAKPVEIDPFFAKKTVREARRLEENRGGLSKFFSGIGSWLTLPRLATAAAAVAVVTFAVSQLNDPARPAGATASVETAPEETVAPNEKHIEALVNIYAEAPVEELDDQFQSIDYLDNLVAVQDAALLTDEDIAALLF